MIGVQFHGWLGNNLFQYVAARSIADQLRTSVHVRCRTGKRGGLLGLFDGHVGQASLRFAESAKNNFSGRVLNFARSFSSMTLMDFPLFNSVYRPPETPTINGWKFESYDEDFWAIENGTMLDGYFQSDKYFARDWKYARRVLGPSPRAVGTALSKLSQLGCDPRNTIAIHVRRGDYLHQTEPFTLSRYGWTLPTSYYTDSIERFSGNQKLLFLTDDPGYVRETFGPDSIVASSSVPSIDLLMLSLCRFNVLSNSTFAWWGAYLGGDEGRTVLAPRYWMGWESQRWMPSDIQVEWWNYVDVQRT